MSSRGDEHARRIPRADQNSSRMNAWLRRLVPERLAQRALSVDLQAPETITLGEPEAIRVVVRNRFPVPLAISTPTSRLWGWAVDDTPEADRRGFTAPETGRSVAFRLNERRVFEASWDGRFCERVGTDTVWRDAPGRHTLTGYLAIENWRARGLYDETDVRVIE